MGKEFKFQPIASPNQREKKAAPAPDKPIKVSAEIPGDLHQHLVSYCFFQFETQSEVITQALREFLKEKPNKPLPEKVRNRPRPGRKAKS